MTTNAILMFLSRSFYLNIETDIYGHFILKVYSMDEHRWILTNYGVSFDLLVKQTYKDLSNKCLI